MSDRRAVLAAEGGGGLSGHPLVQLTLVRIREFTREPEAVFWAIFFPVLLTAGMRDITTWSPADALAFPLRRIAADADAVINLVGGGGRFAWPVTDVTITDARLGHAVQYQPDGAAVLLPAHELSDADGNVWSVVAVVDDRLDFSPAG